MSALIESEEYYGAIEGCTGRLISRSQCQVFDVFSTGVAEHHIEW